MLRQRQSSRIIVAGFTTIVYSRICSRQKTTTLRLHIFSGMLSSNSRIWTTMYRLNSVVAKVRLCNDQFFYCRKVVVQQS